ncbi:MAG: PaaI family thioesterase [Planctomycetota bacterium]|nr:PaaI family thioesterase [Planctomycetota bacterium]
MATPRRPGLVETLGFQEEALAPGRVRCWLTTGAAHQNIQGVIHGVVPMALMDTAMGHALDGLLEVGEFCSTTQISFQFLRAARPGEPLEAIGAVTRKGRRIAYLEGSCTNAAGEVVARAQGTWYVGQVRPAADGAAPG